MHICSCQQVSTGVLTDVNISIEKYVLPQGYESIFMFDQAITESV